MMASRRRVSELLSAFKDATRSAESRMGVTAQSGKTYIKRPRDDTATLNQANDDEVTALFRLK